VPFVHISFFGQQISKCSVRSIFFPTSSQKNKYRTRRQVEILPAYIRGLPAEKPPETTSNVSKIFVHFFSQYLKTNEGLVL